VADGQFGGLNPGVDVLPALLGERPFERAPVRVFQEHAEGVAQVTRAAACGQFDRPVAGRPPRAGEPSAQPCRAVGGQVAEAGIAACAVPPRVPSPSPGSSAAARSAGISSAVTASPGRRIYPDTVSRVSAAPVAAAAISTEASGLPRSPSFLSRWLGDDEASPVPSVSASRARGEQPSVDLRYTGPHGKRRRAGKDSPVGPVLPTYPLWDTVPAVTCRRRPE
jgi:hypothetical protein